jgi:hypothetical protein
MALVSIEAWRAERGIVGGTTAAVMPQAADPADPTVALRARVAELEELAAYQENLIRSLQAALRPFAEAQERAVRDAQAAKPRGRSRVVRQKRIKATPPAPATPATT